ncbi:phage tail tube protein [Williamsia soli]|uniref:phage tail tube protein n=1 Tax=Williamsia soli TaxID=364929 RepID=UPI001A9D86E2|nr:hypothetical protein [Williamsia soli]
MTAPKQPVDTSDLDVTLARHWGLEVRKALTDPWIPVRSIQSLNPTVSKSRQDGGDYHSGNYTQQVATEASWALEVSVGRKLDAAGAPDPGVELLRSVDGELGSDELVYVRWWRTDGLPDSHQGRAGVDFSSAGGEKASLQGATITLTGYGRRETVAKPTAAPVNEIQRLEIKELVTSFKLKLLSGTTSALTVSGLSAAGLQTAITSLAAVGASNALVTGNNASGYNITFTGALAGLNVPTLSVIDIVDGDPGDVVVYATTEGQPAG